MATELIQCFEDLRGFYLSFLPLPMGYLIPTSGEVEPYNGYKLPKQLESPLKASLSRPSKTECLKGYIRYRTVHFRIGERVYKQKGIHPRVKHKFSRRYRPEFTEPIDTMSSKKARIELQANDILNQNYCEYGFVGPLTPAADVEFNVPFTPTSNVHGALLESRGDTRVIELLRDLRSMRKEKMPRQFLVSLSKWLGFSYRILLESEVLPYSDTNSLNNFVFYRMERGYGVARVDLDWSQFKRSEKIIKRQAQAGVVDLLRSSSTKFDLLGHFWDSFHGKIPEPVDEEVIQEIFPYAWMNRLSSNLNKLAPDLFKKS